MLGPSPTVGFAYSGMGDRHEDFLRLIPPVRPQAGALMENGFLMAEAAIHGTPHTFTETVANGDGFVCPCFTCALRY